MLVSKTFQLDKPETKKLAKARCEHYTGVFLFCRSYKGLYFTRGDGGGVDMKKGLGERKMKIFAHKKVIIVLGTYFLFHM